MQRFEAIEFHYETIEQYRVCITDNYISKNIIIDSDNLEPNDPVIDLYSDPHFQRIRPEVSQRISYLLKLQENISYNLEKTTILINGYPGYRTTREIKKGENLVASLTVAGLLIELCKIIPAKNMGSWIEATVNVTENKKQYQNVRFWYSLYQDNPRIGKEHLIYERY